MKFTSKPDQLYQTPQAMYWKERDDIILSSLRKYRLLTTKHLALLQPRDLRATQERLKLLKEHGFIERVYIPIDYSQANGKASYVWQLTFRGANHLGLNRAPKPFRRGDNIEHQLGIAELMVNLECATRKQGQRLIDAETLIERAPIANAMPYPKHIKFDDIRYQGKNLNRGITTDTLFGLEPLGKYFFLEHDRGTEPLVRSNPQQSDIAKKLLVYSRLMDDLIEKRKQGRQAESQFNLPNFRVLFTTTSLQRAENMQALAKEQNHKGRNIFFFAEAEALTQANVLSHVWLNSGEKSGQSLLD